MKLDYFDISPLSEHTLKRHSWKYKGFEYKNDVGFPCDYRVLEKGIELGIITYYRGRKLTSYNIITTS
jgi:hypothetical protein